MTVPIYVHATPVRRSITITPPPKNAPDAELAIYLARVRRQLKRIEKTLPPNRRHRIYLSNGDRGGHFENVQHALVHLMPQVVDRATRKIPASNQSVFRPKEGWEQNIHKGP